MISDAEWHARRAKAVEQAKARPPLFLGNQPTAHKDFIVLVVALGWKAKALRDPAAVSIDVSPHQYCVRVISGPLLPEIQANFRSGGGRTIFMNWREDFEAYANSVSTKGRYGLPKGRDHAKLPWRYCFYGPTGPRLCDASTPALLSTHFVWGVSTDEGLWYERFTNGWPTGTPTLDTRHPHIGIFAAGDLNSDYFTGLPFEKEDVPGLLRGPVRTEYDNIAEWSPPSDLNVRWHPADDILNPGLSAEEELHSLLAGSPSIETQLWHQYVHGEFSGQTAMRYSEHNGYGLRASANSGQPLLLNILSVM